MCLSLRNALKSEGTVWYHWALLAALLYGLAARACGRRCLHPFWEVFLFYFCFWALPVRWDEVWEIAWRYLILVSWTNAVVINLENLLGFVFNSHLKVFCLSSFNFIARAARAGLSTVQMLLAVLWSGLQLPVSTRLLTTLLFLWGCRTIAES